MKSPRNNHPPHYGAGGGGNFANDSGLVVRYKTDFPIAHHCHKVTFDEIHAIDFIPSSV